MLQRIERQLKPQKVETCQRTDWLQSSTPKISPMKSFPENLSADQPVSRSQSASQNELKNLTTKLKRNLSELAKSRSSQVNSKHIPRYNLKTFIHQPRIYLLPLLTPLWNLEWPSLEADQKSALGRAPLLQDFPRSGFCPLFSHFQTHSTTGKIHRNSFVECLMFQGGAS